MRMDNKDKKAKIFFQMGSSKNMIARFATFVSFCFVPDLLRQQLRLIIY